MLLLLIFSLLLLFSVFEICNTKEQRNHEEEKINNILQNYLQPIKQLTDHLPNHQVEIQLEFTNSDNERYLSQSPGKEYLKNIYPKHKGQPSYVILQKPDHQKQQKYAPYHHQQKPSHFELLRNEPHKNTLSSRIIYPRSEQKPHLSHQGYERLEYPRSHFQKPYFDYPRLEQPKAPALALKSEHSSLGYQRPQFPPPIPVLPLDHDHSRTGYHLPQNIEYPRQNNMFQQISEYPTRNNAFLQNNEYPKSDYQTQSDITRYFEFNKPEQKKYSAIDMKIHRPDYPKSSDHEFQRHERTYHQYAPVQPYFDYQNHHDHQKSQVLYVPNDSRHMRRTNVETGIKSDDNSTTTIEASTLTAIAADINPAATQVSSKNPIYMEDLREILNEFVNKLQTTTESPNPSMTMLKQGSLHGNLEEIVQIVKQGLQVAKRLNVPNADHLDWLQIKLPKNLNQ